MHDWTLSRIEVDWQAGTVEVALRSSAGPRIIRARALKRLVVPYLAPWGPSESINGVMVEKTRVLIEMQSGDEIEIVADEIEMPA